jgi:adenosylhomocysteine nucleosidase
MNGPASLDAAGVPLTATRMPGYVVGLVAEARLLRGCGPVAIGGGMPIGAEAAAERLVAGGAGALVSFGLAGGLDPALMPGDLVVAAAVWDDDRRFTADPALCALLGGANAELIATMPAPVATAADKAALFRATGAAAVDLESGAVARVAARWALPFGMLRAVCDPAMRDLPPAALAALDSRGTIGLGRIAAALLRQPAQLPALLRLAGEARAARAALAGAAARLRGRAPHGERG